MPILDVQDVNTLGRLREITKHLPDETPIYIERGVEYSTGDVQVTIHSEHNSGDREVEFS